MTDPVKYLLDETTCRRTGTTSSPTCPTPPPPPLHPGTRQPVGPDDLAPLFPMALIRQEVSTERAIEIPEPVRDVYRLWRPTPLYRARRLEQALETPARDLLQVRGRQPGRQPQAEHRRAAGLLQQAKGVKRLATETGAGQWGSALAFAGALFGLESRSTWCACRTTRSRTAAR